ncbi:DUF4277 domain-containing protein [Streptomyces sp. NPDC002928]|uniref:DUF4277 domain-containing protein n=1 Tax=Streptomyces sp. NPDC002928 TaxID=3154440 RepID=UPI0033A643D7
MEKGLGALPVVSEFTRRLDLAGIVDEVCPGGASAHVTHGQVIEVLVASQLTAPAPLVRVGDWARSWAVEEVFGIEADLLNDDRLAGALDAIAPHLERIAGTVGARAIGEFGIDVAQHNRRVAALIQIICLALLVFCLIERRVRRALGPEQTMAGLYPDNRCIRPTGRMIFYHLGELALRIGTISDPPTVQITRGVQLHLLHLLDLLDTGIGQIRWPQT